MSAAAKPKAAPKKPAEHPKYIEMIKAAVAALKERNGSSRQAITKYIQANYKVSLDCGVHIKLALRKAVAKGELAQPKGKGASGSFKLVKPVKVEKKKPAKKPAAKKAAAKKPAAKKAVKKPAAKKSPKKPAAKKAKKPAAKKSPAKKAKPAKKPAAKKAAKSPAKKAAKKPAAKKPAKKAAKKAAKK